MNATRATLIASALLGMLALAAAALAAPSPDGGATSGGAQVIPVVPSEGGGSEPLAARTSAVPETAALAAGRGAAVQEAPAAPQTPDGLALPLQGLSLDPTPESRDPTAEQGASSGGGFSFLATTGLEIVSAVIALLRSAAG